MRAIAIALIKCPECGREVSDKAECCQGCGCPNSPMVSKKTRSIAEIKYNNKKLLFGAVVIAAFIGLIIIVNASDKRKSIQNQALVVYT